MLAASELTTPILARLQRDQPRLEIRLRLADYDDPSAGLRANTADIAFVRRPLAGDFAFVDLFDEPRVAVLPRAREATQVRIDELQDDVVIADPGPDAVWRAFYTADDVRGGPPERTVTVSSFDEELTTVALGRAISFTSAAAARLYARPDIAYVPLADAAPCTVSLAWDPQRPPAQLDAIASAATSSR